MWAWLAWSRSLAWSRPTPRHWRVRREQHEFIAAVEFQEPDIAFPFLHPAVLDDIEDEHGQMDQPPLEGGVHGGLDDWHFDDCELDGAVEFINDRYDSTQSALANRSAFGATDQFGNLLHTVMDFYAHSNWVEMGFPQTDDPDTPEVDGAERPSSTSGGAQGSLGLD